MRGVFIAAFFILARAGAAEEPKEYDLVVYGGTPGGIAAAVMGAREGLSVELLEVTKHLGGMTSGGLSHTDVGPKPEILGGFAREFYTRADAKYPRAERMPKDFWYHEPHVAEETFAELLREAKVEVVFGARVEGVEKEGTRIGAFRTVDGKRLRGRLFIDATYEGDLMARAGVSYTVGRESRAKYGESLAGFHPAPFRSRTPEYMSTPGTAYTHGTPTRIFASKDGKLLPGVSQIWGIPGESDALSQSYNFRVIVTDDPANRVAFPKPAKYDPLRYEILAQIIDAFPGVRFEKLVFHGALPHRKFDANASGLVQGTDHVGANAAYPEAAYPQRDAIWQDHVEYVQGFFWFLANDPRVPAALRAQASAYGLAADEFRDNANWPYALYVREARRMLGEYVVRQEDCAKGRKQPDSIGMGAFILDSHAVQRLADKDGNVIDEGNFDVGVRPYQIPYRCVTPGRTECDNLLVPVALSASHVTYGSIRMEPQFMILGHSCGVAAAMALREKCAVQVVPMAALQEKLRAQGQVLELVSTGPTLEGMPGITKDDDDAVYAGEWLTSTFGNPLEGTSHHDLNEGKGAKEATFELKVPRAGTYEVRLAYPASSNRASNVPVRIISAESSKIVTVDERKAPPIDKLFVSLGTYRFSPEKPAVISILTTGTDGFVAVDAVQLLPVEVK
jgi:hypothetical protein